MQKKSKQKEKKVPKVVGTPKKPFAERTASDYFCELWDRFKIISRSSSV